MRAGGAAAGKTRWRPAHVVHNFDSSVLIPMRSRHRTVIVVQWLMCPEDGGERSDRGHDGFHHVMQYHVMCLGPLCVSVSRTVARAQRRTRVRCAAFVCPWRGPGR